METESDESGVGRVPRTEGLKEDLALEKKRNEELLTRLKYMQADLENSRKRMDKEMKEAGESVARALVGRLLVVQDELDLAIKHTQGKADSELMEGIGMVRSNLMSALESVGVERIEAAGKTFDPALHEAVERVQGSSTEGDLVVEEVRPGYTFRGQLLRPSMVKVELASKKPGEAKADE